MCDCQKSCYINKIVGMNVWHQINGTINPGTAEAAKKKSQPTTAAKANKRAQKA